MPDIIKTLNYFSREDEENQTKLLAKKYNLSYTSLVNYPIIPDVLHIIPEEISKKYSLVSYMKIKNTVRVATSHPEKEDIKKIVSELEKSTELQFSLSVCSDSSYRYAAQLYLLYPLVKATAETVTVSEKQEKKYKEEIKNLIDLKNKIRGVSATELLDIIFAGAVATGSSDIHVEPEEKDLKIRYRIDGILQTIAELPLLSHKTVVSRIKYLAKLKIDITDQPQDGRFEVEATGKPYDIRVSVLPTAYGEAVVMRLLSREGSFITLEDLGFTNESIKIINDAISKPNGIIFNTGPTGSGKTTTLYAVLEKLNKPGVKIITLEDPVEYRIKGIDQSQIETEKGYTFASGLRSALRQDPDIIMVGEIRDKETAETSIQASLTGHLVITTLHTNNAPSTLPRLLDMGVEPYLLSGVINLVIAQRLVRKICKKCLGKGCVECNNTGYRGRIAISELLVPNKEIEDMIIKHASVRDFEEAAKRAGMISMYEDGMQKVKAGLTTEEEILRVVRK